MKGSVTNIGTNLWLLRYDLPRGPDGKRRPKKQRVKGTRKQADAILAKLLTEVNEGSCVEPSKLLVGNWLDRWLDEVAASRVCTTTLGPYRSHLKAVKEALGGIKLTDLTSRDIQRYSLEAQERLETQTVHHHLVILKQCLKQAVDEGLLVKNPADAVKAPRPAQKSRPALEVEQVKDLLAAVKATPLHIPVTLALGAGLRASEVLGLKWSAVRLDQNLLWVEQVLSRRKGGLELKQPKTRTSRRPVPLPASVTEALRAHQKTSPTSDMVVCMEDGRPMRHEFLSKNFGKLMDAMGWPEITFHSLRRTHASLLAHAGVAPKAVQERLGHSNIETTLGIYTTVLGGAARCAAETYDALLAAD